MHELTKRFSILLVLFSYFIFPSNVFADFSFAGIEYPDPPTSSTANCSYMVWIDDNDVVNLMVQRDNSTPLGCTTVNTNNPHQLLTSNPDVLTPWVHLNRDSYIWTGASWAHRADNSGPDYALPQDACLNENDIFSTIPIVFVGSADLGSNYCDLGEVTNGQTLDQPDVPILTTLEIVSSSVSSSSGQITLSTTGSFSYSDVSDEDICQLDLYDSTESLPSGAPSRILSHVFIRGEFLGATLGSLPPDFSKLPTLQADYVSATGNVRSFAFTATLDNTIGSPFNLQLIRTCYLSRYDDELNLISHDSTGAVDSGYFPIEGLPDQEDIDSQDACFGASNVLENISCQINFKFDQTLTNFFSYPINNITDQVNSIKTILYEKAPFAYALSMLDWDTSSPTKHDLIIPFGDIVGNEEANINVSELDMYDTTIGYLKQLETWFFYIAFSFYTFYRTKGLLTHNNE